MQIIKELDPSILKSFTYPEPPGFGTVIVPISLMMDINKEDPKDLTARITNNTKMSLSTFNSALHYGQSIFEGMKSFKLKDGDVCAFRLDDYAKRFRNSAGIMNMFQMEADDFKTCITEFLKACKEVIPDNPNHSLYLRPFMFALDPVIKVSSSKTYRFVITASIVGSYFSSGKQGVQIYCNNKFVRAFPYGTGEAKTAANYALSLPHLNIAQSKGYEQVLYLDSVNHKYIEELGGMNFFMLKDGKLITPKLKGTVLRGITRDTILTIASHFDLQVEERDIEVDEIVKPKEGTYLFTSGTAATIIPVIKIGYHDADTDKIIDIDYEIHSLAKDFRSFIYQTQTNQTKFSENWVTVID